MARPKITPELIVSQGEQLLDRDISWQRATELAPEVQKLNDAVLNAAGMLDFNDDPGRLAATLSALKGGTK